MSTTTDNYGLIKPDDTDIFDVQHMNDNSDTIDTALNKLASDIASNGLNIGYNLKYITDLQSGKADTEHTHESGDINHTYPNALNNLDISENTTQTASAWFNTLLLTVNAMLGTITTQGANITTNAEDIDTLEGKVATNESNISDLSEQVGTNTSNISDLQTSLDYIIGTDGLPDMIYSALGLSSRIINFGTLGDTSSSSSSAFTNCMYTTPVTIGSYQYTVMFRPTVNTEAGVIFAVRRCKSTSAGTGSSAWNDGNSNSKWIFYVTMDGQIGYTSATEISA